MHNWKLWSYSQQPFSLAQNKCWKQFYGFLCSGQSTLMINSAYPQICALIVHVNVSRINQWFIIIF